MYLGNLSERRYIWVENEFYGEDEFGFDCIVFEMLMRDLRFVQFVGKLKFGVQRF